MTKSKSKQNKRLAYGLPTSLRKCTIMLRPNFLVFVNQLSLFSQLLQLCPAGALNRKLLETGSDVKPGSDHATFRRVGLISIRGDICLSSTVFDRQAITFVFKISVCEAIDFLYVNFRRHEFPHHALHV